MGFLKVEYFVGVGSQLSNIVDVRVIFLWRFDEGRIKTLNELMKIFFRLSFFLNAGNELALPSIR